MKRRASNVRRVMRHAPRHIFGSASFLTLCERRIDPLRIAGDCASQSARVESAAALQLATPRDESLEEVALDRSYAAWPRRTRRARAQPRRTDQRALDRGRRRV